MLLIPRRGAVIETKSAISQRSGEEPFDLEVYIRAIGYLKPLLEVTKDGKETKGRLKGTFEIQAKEPDGFKTKTLK